MNNPGNPAAGDDLKSALLVIMNKIKDQLTYPQALEACNISSLHKKGIRNGFGNSRGIFIVTMLRTILY